jgi:hypothetical protein
VPRSQNHEIGSDISVDKLTALTGRTGASGFGNPPAAEISVFTTACRRVVQPNKSFEMGTAGLSLGVERPRPECDHCPHNVDFRNIGSWPATDPCIFIAGCVIKQWESFTAVKV